MIDVDIRLRLQDGQRQFSLAARFATDAGFVALYGPSGSGKSLTLRAMAGLLQPTAGHVRVQGRTLFDAATGKNVPPAQRGVGYLFQDYALFPHLSVRENVAFGLVTWPRRRPPAPHAARVDQLLEDFGLAALADSRPGTLSGGQQQRVALARALACEPRILLLDEPFAALNPMLRHELRTELAQVRRQWGIPAVMITHDADDVLALADVAFIYEHGEIVREIDVHRGESRALARQALGTQQAELTPEQRRVRSLLHTPDR